MGGFVININNIQSLSGQDIQQSHIFDRHGTESLFYVVTLNFIDNLSYWFFIFNSLQIKLLHSLLFIHIGFYDAYHSKHKTFTGRSRTPAIYKKEIFVKDVNGGKSLLIKSVLRCDSDPGSTSGIIKSYNIGQCLQDNIKVLFSF